MTLAGAGTRLHDMAVQAVQVMGGAAKRVFFTRPLSSAPPIQEGKALNDNGTIAHSPEVLQFMEELRLARESDAATAADLTQAESVISDLTAERGRLAASLRASEEALALSGALPEGEFPEERPIAHIDRRIRVAKSRVQLISGKAAESRANIERLKKGLRGAFGVFVTSQLAEVRARFRATALSLREIYSEQFPWIALANLAGIKVPGADVAVIADPEYTDKRRELLDSRDYGRSDRPWQSFKPLQARLAELHAEVTAAIGETPKSKPAPAAKPAPQRSYSMSDPEVWPLVFGPGAASRDAFPEIQVSPLPMATQPAPAGGGAGLPGSGEHGIG